MKVGFNSIILFVRDVERLKHFNTEFLGLRLTEEINSEWVVLKAGACELALHRIAADYSPDNENPVQYHSNTKIVFDVDEDLFILHPKLANNDISIKPIRTWDNYPYWVCDGEDPDGNVFQLRMKKKFQLNIQSFVFTYGQKKFNTH